VFDGLKDKLNSFREDVEETAEEAADADESADDAGEQPESSDAAETDTPESATVNTDATADADATEVDTETTNADTASTAESATAKPTTEKAVAASDDNDDDEDSGSSGPGTLKRAAAFATGKVIIEEDDLEDPLWDLEMALIQSDVEMSVAEEILETVEETMIGETRKQVETTGELVERALHDALVDVISVGQFDFDGRIAAADKPVTIVFTGVNGVGKTTSIAKLSEYFADRGYSSVLANGDTYRAGANEQLQQHAETLDRRVITHEQGGDPAAVIYDGVEYAEANDVDVVLGDTAGRLHTSDDLMAQLEKIDRVVDPDMTLFVDEAVAGQDAVMRAQEFNDAAAVDGTVLTKADVDASGGAAISIASVTGKPILFFGTGQGYEDIEPFDPEELVAALLGDEE
jgi:signal recognition particle-docking protein FtsY